MSAEELSPRQVAIGRLLLRGRSYKGIADELELSVRTVQNYVQDAGRKLGGRGTPKARLTLHALGLLKRRHRNGNGRHSS